MRYNGEGPPAGFVFGAIAALIFILMVVSCLSGCATTQCPPCVPERETITIKQPVDACEPALDVPPIELPTWPSVPAQGVSEAQLKAFYAQVVATQNAREKIYEEYIRNLQNFKKLMEDDDFEAVYKEMETTNHIKDILNGIQ